MDTPSGWQFWIDRGGTFTDVVARDPAGRIHVRKLLSENPERYPDAPLQAIRDLLGVAADEPLPSDAIDSVKMGTTLATNALLERRGVPVGLVITRGFGDLLEIGYQNRPDLFALEIVKPEPLAIQVVEADERVLADGTVRRPLDEADLRESLAALRAEGVDSIAVVFLHSYAHPAHELAAERVAQDLGFRQISLSHRVAREIKAVARGDTACIDAYLTPIIRDYVATVRAALTDRVPLRFVQSSGGLADAERFTGKDAVLSGPAGGAVACAHVARLAGFDRVIGFDMGGTSTDVSRFDGAYERVNEKVVAGVRLKAPMMHIETVAAGGGSMLAFDGRRFTVGPESAGADPGPACYRRGGPAAVTDSNLVLGRIQPEHFPRCFGPAADQPLDAGASRQRLAEIAEHVREATGKSMRVEEVAAGFVRIANENMAKPIKEISVSRGYDVQEYALVCFGGAAAQHACALADALGIRAIVLHPYAGVLSAYGMGLADMTHTDVAAVLRPLDATALRDAREGFANLTAAGKETLMREGFVEEQIGHELSLDLRYEGTDTPISVRLEIEDGLPAVLTRFAERHQALYGFVKDAHPVELVNLRVASVGRTEKPPEPARPAQPKPVSPDAAIDVADVYFDVTSPDGSRALTPLRTPVYRRDDLAPGGRLNGPAIIVEDVSTVVVDPGWSVELNEFSHLVLTAEAGPGRKERVAQARDPVLLEVFNNLFMSVADQMGRTLERVSHSVNMKERLDFSCAVFDASGELVANAHHIPVHLGAMGETVRAVLTERGEGMTPGDVYVTNNPYRGGSHLPDVTVVTPVFSPGGERLFCVANRGHHADVGGVTPGSMPPSSKTLDEEGVVIDNFLLVACGGFREEEITALLSSGPYPARNIPERLSDLRAQIAANEAGVRLLRELCAKYGVEGVHAYMRHVRDNAAEAMRETLAALPDGVHTFTDHLDSGAAITCTVTIARDRAVVDFTGTAPQLEGNLNAPPAVTTAAVLYVFRTLVNRPIPLNGGCLDPIEIRIPPGCLLNPRYPAAVAGGNVETSMRVVDAVYGALGALAAGQGTMNNLSFGTRAFGYYETICGGAGAGNGFHGASAVHTYMTNTRITDPEVLEHRYPAVVRRFTIRRGSGGDGAWRGGDGVIRALEFLEPMEATLLSERRHYAPYGLHGAQPGSPGRNTLERDGNVRELPGQVHLSVQPGDVLTVETPGGGGYNADEGEPRADGEQLGPDP